MSVRRDCHYVHVHAVKTRIFFEMVVMVVVVVVVVKVMVVDAVAEWLACGHGELGDPGSRPSATP